MTSRSGLTLIEVLAATALLAVVVGACVSVFQSIGASLEKRYDAVAWSELGSLADRMMRSPEDFNLDINDLAEHAGAGPQLIAIDLLGTDHADVRLLRADDPVSRHTWLEIHAQGRSVYRWVPLPQALEATP